MKKYMIICALLCMSQWVVAQDMFQELLFPAGFILGNKETIHLTPRQEGRIKEIHNENQSLFSERRMALNQANEQLKVLLNAEKTDESGINAQMDKVLVLENELKKMQLQSLLTIRSELNSKQVAQLKALRQNEDLTVLIGNDKVFRVQVAGAADAKTPSYFILHQGKYYSLTDINTIQPKDIQSVSVLKDAKAIEQFGSEGRNGVIIITLKDASVIDLNELRIHIH